MKIYLSSAELDVAIKEYMTKRGIDADKYIGTEFKAGRKGNGTTAYVMLGVVPVETTDPTPKIYAGVNKQLDNTIDNLAIMDDIRAEKAKKQEEANSSYEEYEAEFFDEVSPTMEEDLAIFDEPAEETPEPVAEVSESPFKSKKLFGR